MVATKPDGSERVVADWFPNLITDYGLEAWATSGYILRYCRVGSGTTQPTVLDTSLVAQVASATATGGGTGSQSSPPYYVWVTYNYVFAQGVAAGNLSEVGVGITATGADLWSRSRIKDGGGNDTTITILSDEQLTVTYQLRLYVPTTDVTGTISIGGVSRSFVMRAAQCTTGWSGNTYNGETWYSAPFGTVPYNMGSVCYDGSLGAITSSPSGNAANFCTGYSLATYAANSKYRDLTYTSGINEGNLAAGISAVILRSMNGFYQISFSPALAKDNTKTCTLTIRQSWARR